jgi:hypothetical protein
MNKTQKRLSMQKTKDTKQKGAKQLMVNGPLNVIRVEGKINGKLKVLYLFGDTHTAVENQTECDDIHAHDVDKYILEQFKKQCEETKNKNGSCDNEQKIDMFLEISPDGMTRDSFYNTHKHIYIQKIKKIFMNQFMTHKNKTILANDYDNVRLHYIDFRTYFPKLLSDTIDLMVKKTHEYGALKTKIHDNISLIKIIKTQCINMLKIMKKPKKNNINIQIDATRDKMDVTETTDIQKFQILENMFYKIRNVYHNDNIKQKINEAFDLHVVKEYENFIKYVEETKLAFDDLLIKINESKYKLIYKKNGFLSDVNYGYDDNIENIQKELSVRVNKIRDYESTLNFMIIDYYMVRRMLDKEYISNSINYAGLAHTANTMYLLLKYFDFDITHIAKSSGNDLKKLKKNIVNLKYPSEAIFYIIPPEKLQCSNLTDFPEQFK